jgi:hypothetical protein
MRLFRIVACAAGLLCCSAAANTSTDRFRELQIRDVGRAVERQAPTATIRSTEDPDARFQAVQLAAGQKAALAEALKAEPLAVAPDEQADNSVIAFPAALRVPGTDSYLAPYVRGITRYSFDPARRLYLARIGIAVSDLANPGRVEPLAKPISFRVTNAARGGRGTAGEHRQYGT